MSMSGSAGPGDWLDSFLGGAHKKRTEREVEREKGGQTRTKKTTKA